jgi:hypothetical protein
MNEVKFYTIDCPACMVLEKKLEAKGVVFTKINDIETLQSLNIEQFPVLEVNNEFLPYPKAVKWVNSL